LKLKGGGANFNAELQGILPVVHCFRETGATIRIISARKATKTETWFYPGG
jgi:uncharacterized DUF497 family protein